MNSDFTLDQRLARDCHRLAELPLCELLLMNNALLPWFILVPRVAEVELHQLTTAQQHALLGEVNLISRFVQEAFAPDKLNVAAIGNIVRQLHVHVVGRRESDICWPGVVWGVQQREPYTQAALDAMVRNLREFLPAQTVCHQVVSKP